KLWAAIQDGNARTTPGMAVGLSFIPFWNLYWMFQVYYGWALDFNRYAAYHRRDVPPVSEGVPLAACILQLCGFIPYVGGLFQLAGLILLLIHLSSAIDAVNALGATGPDGYDDRDDYDDRWEDARSKFADRRREADRDRDEDRGSSQE